MVSCLRKLVTCLLVFGLSHVSSAAAGGEAKGDGSFDPLNVQWSMFFLFLIVFVLALFILKKYAFGPILAALDEREKLVRESVENAERVRNELKGLEATRRDTIAEADAKAKEVIEEARKGAIETARSIEHKAKEEVTILLENARREIATAEARAQANLRTEATRLSIDLASKVLSENLDDKKNRELVDRLIADL